MLDQGIAQLAAQLRRGPVVVLSGAGLSTASGIPAYRDRAGQWQHARPIQHQDFLRSAAVRQRYWARSFVGWPTIGRAQPAAGHRALARLQQRGVVTRLVTQNVDGLHQQAGSREVVELHGGLARVGCLACGESFARAQVQEWLLAANPDFAPPAPGSAPDGDAALHAAAYAEFRVPACPSCGGVLKPEVVFFGDSVPKARVEAAFAALDEAASLLVVGSSLMVYSGFRFADYAHRHGKPVLAINQGITRADPLLACKVEADCGVALQALLPLLD